MVSFFGALGIDGTVIIEGMMLLKTKKGNKKVVRKVSYKITGYISFIVLGVNNLIACGGVVD